jgi:YesN/AraC family two-component response regulator
MPRMNGYELVSKIKALQPKIKVILMSAFEIKEEEFSRVLPSIEIGGLISKPISMKNLLNASKILQNKKAYRSNYMKNIISP